MAGAGVDGGGGDGRQDRGVGAPRAVTTRMRAEDRRDGDHCQGWTVMAAARTRISLCRGNPSKFWVAGADEHQSRSGAPAQGKPQQHVTARHPP